MQNEDYGHFDQPRGSEDIDLAQFDDDFAHAEVEEREFETIPDGKYQVNVERAELTRAQTSGNPMLKWTLRILAPKFREGCCGATTSWPPARTSSGSRRTCTPAG